VDKLNILEWLQSHHAERETPIITLLRRSGYFMRTTAGAVILAFVGLIITPSMVGIRTAMAAEAVEPIPSTVEGKLSHAIQQAEQQLERLEQKLNSYADTTQELTALQQLHDELTLLDAEVTANFQQVGDLIQSKGLPEVIQQRHQTMVNSYQAELTTLLNNLTAIDQATDSETRKQKTQAAKAHLQSKKQKKGQQPFDPKNLPNKSRKADPNNKPKKNADEFQSAGLFNTPFIKLAALGDFTFDKLAGASDPAYLAETDEIVLTQSIQDKAAELNHDPVKIFHWVRNNTEWQPTWGAIQDAELTLDAKRGNAMDIASLTIALLRASGIPARYVHGTIEVPAEEYKNWTGGFSEITAAANFASSGGIPTTAITTAGVISKIQMEHVWVEAAIDYQPSRGAINRSADSWVAMDASYKQYEYLQGLDAVAISGIDPEQLAQSFIDSGTVNEGEGWVTGFDPTILQNAQTQAQTNLEDHITNNMTDPTVGDVIGGRKTIIKEYPVLPSSLPNLISAEGARYDKLPSQLQQKVTYTLANGLTQTGPSASFPWARLNNQKVTLSFKPATAADEQALQSLLPEGEITDISQLPSSIPSYLIEVIPELKVNGQQVLSGNPMPLGHDLAFKTQVQFAGKSAQTPYTYNLAAGSYRAVNVIAGSVSPQKLHALQTQLEQTKTILETSDQTQIAALTRGELLGDMFYAGSLGYYAQLLGLSHIAGLAQGGHYTLAAGKGTIGYEPKVNYFFGFPISIASGGVALDIPINIVAAVDDGDLEKRKNYVLQTGILSSALEHAVPEQMFVTPENPGEAISAVKALSKASAAGQRIYHITQANRAVALPNIHHDSGTMAEISAALNAGKEVITHSDAVSVPGWSGAGYIILDPDEGDGAYKISGGGNGGFFVALLITMIAFVVGFFLLQSSLILGGLLLAWEGLNFAMWISAIRSANSHEAFNQANFSQAVVGLLGLAPFAATGVSLAVVVQWFGILFAFMLTSLL